MPAIFNFDQTICKKHTFNIFKKESDVWQNLTSPYENGKEHAIGNLKEGCALFLKHDDEHISAIATYHNNPEFVAGYMATLLNEELKLVDTILDVSVSPIAINIYQVEETHKPFLIGYLPCEGHDYQEAIGLLKNKNRLIECILDYWIEKNLIHPQTIIDFYDDSKSHCRDATLINYMCCHLVDGCNKTFTVNETISANINFDELDSEPGVQPKMTFNQLDKTAIETQLRRLSQKAQQLKQNGHMQAYEAASRLGTNLTELIEQFESNQIGSDEFHKRCNNALQSAHIELDQHRGWKAFLANLAFAILGLGIGLIIKGAINLYHNRPFLFFAKTDSTLLLEETKDVLNRSVVTLEHI